MTVTDGAQTGGPAALPSQATTELVEAKHRIDSLEQELAQTRRQPWVPVFERMKYRVLTALARHSPPIPAAMAARFSKSAAKCSPNRSLSGDAAPEDGEGRALSNVGAYTHGGRLLASTTRETVLVVTHDASRSGAPILAQNIAGQLSKDFNVVVLALRPGDILNSFKDVAIEVNVARRFLTGGTRESALVRDLCKRHNFAFAIVNSIASRGVLPSLKQANVPIVMLVHEFTAYVKPRTAIQDVAALSDAVIFSSRLTLDDALANMTAPVSLPPRILPQGKCVVPQHEGTRSDRDSEVAWLRQSMRPHGTATTEFVVMGAGTVSYRKGVDLFIDCATRILADPRGQNARFVWFGQGYEPDRDMGYSAYLRDQVQRAGIQDRLTFLRDTSEIEAAYDLADALLLSSRLDPLPNVAIDAMTKGRTVFCFDRATGIADALIEGGLERTCVGRYLDSHNLAEKMLTVIASPALTAEVSQTSRDVARQVFNMDTYVADLVATGRKAAAARASRA